MAEFSLGCSYGHWLLVLAADMLINRTRLAIARSSLQIKHAKRSGKRQYWLHFVLWNMLLSIFFFDWNSYIMETAIIFSININTQMEFLLSRLEIRLQNVKRENFKIQISLRSTLLQV